MADTILVVDDDPVQRRLLESMVRRFGFEVRAVEGGDAAMAVLEGPEGESIACVVLDLVMPDLDGLGVLARLRARGDMTPVIVQTAHGGIDTVVSAVRAGASDFVVKPVGAERLHVSLRNAISRQALEHEVQRLKRKVEGTLGFSDIVTRSERMSRVIKLAEKASASTIPVLIEGESGVGKELVARAIAGSGERSGKPFVAVNCGAIPDNLVESILFGHEKGAFTGATERHLGKFLEANGGTLFLDEVGELPPAAQVKLLRALQEGEVDPVGGRRTLKVDVRIVSATNRDLIAAVRAGRFREDLYYRLAVFPLTIPPLRERLEDIPELVRHFLARFAAEEGRRVRAVSPEAMRLLVGHHWPGNVRQLENAVFRAVVLADADEIGVEEFPQIVAQAARAGLPETDAPPGLAGPLVMSPPITGPDTSPGPFPVPELPAGTLPMLDDLGEIRPMVAIEEAVVRFAIDHYGGQMSTVARRLGIGRSTLYRKLKEWGISDAAGVEESPESHGSS